GTSCVVLTLKDMRLFLDPRLDFAVRRSEETKKGKPLQVRTADDFVEILPRVWFPKKQHQVVYAGIDGKRAGQPEIEVITDVTNVEVNRPEHLTYFTVNVPPGSWVNDQKLAALDKEGNKVRAR